MCRVTVPAVKLQSSVTLLHLFSAHRHFAIEVVTDAWQTGVRGNGAVDRFYRRSPARSCEGDLVGLAKLLAEEIDGNQRGHKYCDNHRPAANLFAGKSKIVKCHIPQSNRDIARYANCAGNRHHLETAFHLAHPKARSPMNSSDGE